MAQWGKNDVASNSVLWGVAGYNKTANSANRDAFFDNVSRGAYITNMIVGQFGVDTTEVGVGNGNVVHITVTNNGSGYSSNPTLSFSGGGGSSAAATGVANATGRIASVNISNGGSSYETNPSVTIPAPSVIVFNGNTDISSNSIVTSSSGKFLVGDYITYAGNVTSTPVGLTDQTRYYVVSANSTAIQLSTTSGGTVLGLTPASGTSVTAGGATIQGETATATAVVGGAKNKGVSHAGWNVRRVGTGGRAGRVQYETLVAMGSITGDASDDSILPDSNT